MNMETLLVGTVLPASLGVAFLVQKAALEALLHAMRQGHPAEVTPAPSSQNQ